MKTTQLIPALRPLRMHAIVHEGYPALYLQDPLQLSERVVVLPRTLAPILWLCDGAHDAVAIRVKLLQRYGLAISLEMVLRVAAVLDDALLLDNVRFEQVQAQRLQAYRAAPYRPPALAGHSYPAEASALFGLLNDYLESAGETAAASEPGRGVFSPHIDYPRGGHVYAQVWKRAAAAAASAELVVIFGTDHFSDRPLNLTRQHYATPYGVLPTDQAIVDELAQAIGPTQAFGGELRHSTEHSLELALVWLHHLRGGRPVTVVPILTGSFGEFIHSGRSPAADPTLQALLATLQRAAAGRRTLVVASGDLSHVGPAFGGAPVGANERRAVQTDDAELLARMAAGDAAGFFAAIQRMRDRNNVCGVSSIYLALRFLGATHGEQFGYDFCPADDQLTSHVSVGGMVFF